MSTFDERDLDQLLMEPIDIQPPDDLADRIKAEIPADLRLAPELHEETPSEVGESGNVVDLASRRRRWPTGVLALAASLVLAVGLAVFVLDRDPELLDPASQGGLAETHPPSTTQSDEIAERPVEDDTAGPGTPASSGDEAGDLQTKPAAATQESESRDSLSVASDDAERKATPFDVAESTPGRLMDRRSVGANESGLLPAEPEATAESDLDVVVFGIPDSAEMGEETGTERAQARRVPIPDPTPDEPMPPVDASPTPAPSSPVPSSPPPPPAPARPAMRQQIPKPKALPEVAAGRASGGEAESRGRRLDDSSSMRGAQERRAELEETVVAPGAAASGAEALRRNPNDEPYDAVFFESAGVNPFVDTEDDALSTFGLDVDTASYTVARRMLRDGNLPPKESVRVEEFVNFFDYGDPAPTGRDDFALRVEGAPSPWGEGERYYLLRVGLRARDVLEAHRPPTLLTFVVDVSGSMNRENRLGLVQRSLGLLLENLREDDRVALVVYGSQGRVLLEPTSDHARVRAAIDQLRSEGSTNAAEGLRLGYELTARHRRAGDIHRVILCSDGVANAGTTTSGEGILAEVARFARQGIELTTVGVGMGNYNDTLMETLADQGNGRYAYVDTLEEARRIFVDDLTGTLVTVAAEARAQVEFDPELVSRYRLIGYENRDIADHRFRDDTVDAGEIGAGHTVTAVYEIKTTNHRLRDRDRLGTVRLRYASIARGEMVEQSLDITGEDLAPTFDRAPRSLRLAAVTAELAEALRGSYWARTTDLREVFVAAQKVSADSPGDADVAELAALVGKAERLWQRRMER